MASTLIPKRTAHGSAATPKRKTLILEHFHQLPNDIKEKTIASGISEKDAEANLLVLLNILHFKTKHNFYTPQQYNDPERKKVKRHNRDQSLVDPEIVSTASLSTERATLLADASITRTYTISQQVGKGGFGRVFAAFSPNDNRDIAIKKMPHETTKQKRKNYQEIRFLKYLAQKPSPAAPNAGPNNHVLKFIRATLYQSEIWLATELINGGTLTQAVNSHKFTEPEIAYVCRELLLGIKLLHDHQLAHRDLKSANIMFDLDANVKLIDFGLCSDISQGEVVHMVGSPFWMPPEMIRREYHGLPVDIWSFGICVMELANGHPPNRKSSIKAMFIAAVEGYPNPFETPGKWSLEFTEFLTSCLKSNPRDRPTVDKLLTHSFLTKAASKDSMRALMKTIFGDSLSPSADTMEIGD